MVAYADTSFFFSLYAQDANTAHAGQIAASLHAPLLITPIQRHELRNAFRLSVTQDAAKHFAEIAAAMRKRGLDPAAVAHFLDRLVFCLFAEDTRLLPDRVFSRIVKKSGGDPARFCKTLGQLFESEPQLQHSFPHRSIIWNRG